jgi:hypothetical protein
MNHDVACRAISGSEATDRIDAKLSFNCRAQEPRPVVQAWVSATAWNESRMPVARLSVVAVTLLAWGQARADTIVTSQSAFQSAVTGGVETTSFRLPYYSYTTSVTLADGNVLSTASSDEVAGSGSGFAPFTNGYGGDLLVSNGVSETISFGSVIDALGFFVAPDVGLTLGGLFPNPVSFTITLSNGQTITTPTSDYNPGDALYVGFYGAGDVTSMTITVNGTNGLNGSVVPDFAFGDFTTVPEPGSLAVLAGGLVALGFVRRKASHV